MTRAGAIVALAMAATLAPLRARAQVAQAPANQISYGAVMRAPVGTWAEYLMSKEGEAQTVRVRYTLVERSAKKLALELDSLTPIGRVLMRLEFTPSAGRWKLAKARTRLGTQPPKDSVAPEGPDGKGTSFGKGDSFGERIARENVAVKAGKFDADHYRRQVNGWTTDVWMDERLSPIGMLQLTDGQGGRIELLATGKDGKSGF